MNLAYWPVPELARLPKEEAEALQRAARDTALRGPWIPLVTIVGFAVMVVVWNALNTFAQSRINPGVPGALLRALAPLVGLLGAAFVVLRLRKRAIQKYIWSHVDFLCSGCGYDLTGNASGVCPECGREIGPESGRKVE